VGKEKDPPNGDRGGGSRGEEPAKRESKVDGHRGVRRKILRQTLSLPHGGCPPPHNQNRRGESWEQNTNCTISDTLKNSKWTPEIVLFCEQEEGKGKGSKVKGTPSNKFQGGLPGKEEPISGLEKRVVLEKLM